ncbi:MAG: guanylate kinase [Candidatus Izemoplasmatales bacterium]
MLVLVGPSASGKTESAKIMINRYHISRVVTCTTRPKRLNEIDGFDYHFLSEEAFLIKKAQGYFIETTEYNGFYYGTPKNELGDDKFIILEPKGLQSFLKLDIDLVSIFLKTKEDIRIQRMKQRKDKIKDIKARIEEDRKEFDLDQIEGLDLVIDTTNLTLSEVADLIYKNYIDILVKKKSNVNQLSLFEGDL